MKYKYYMLNKPAGCITAKRDSRHKVVMEYMEDADGDNLNPVGRLDKDTEGLLFVTNDGKWNQLLMSPQNHVKKKYYFVGMGKLDSEKINRLKSGVILRGESVPCKAIDVEVTDNKVLADVLHIFNGKRTSRLYKNKDTHPVVMGNIIITEGRKHQVKRMLKAAGCYVIYLKRTEIGNVKLDDTLCPGGYRELTSDEVNSFYSHG